MTATALDPDVDALTDWAPADQCEHSQHTTRTTSHADGDEHHVLVFSPCGCDAPEVLVFCRRYLQTVAEKPLCVIRCPKCGRLDTPDEVYQDLGPIHP